MRKYLAPAFSDRSLKAQEGLIAAGVDNFVSQIGARGGSGIDLVNYFNLATFDIIGSLAFGRDFGGVSSGTPPASRAVTETATDFTQAGSISGFPSSSAVSDSVLWPTRSAASLGSQSSSN